jgi:hypothetical protein
MALSRRYMELKRFFKLGFLLKASIRRFCKLTGLICRRAIVYNEYTRWKPKRLACVNSVKIWPATWKAVAP